MKSIEDMRKMCGKVGLYPVEYNSDS